MKTFIFYFFLFSIGASAAPVNNQKNLIQEKTKIENPFNLRDPFKAPQTKNDTRSERGFKVTGKGEYSNIVDTPLEQISLSQIKVAGVLIGKERRAMINVSKDSSSSKIVILKEGMKIGPDNAELKAILPGGIVLVEKIINVYGEEEFLETVIPISK